ncbi:MAG TPA: MFS transporter [Nocardioidaceae bacterium]|nr:MFS transporter [Nocardioidaceae bacterium]
MTPSSPRATLALACAAVAFAAADTYVVVLALPDMMSGVGLSIDELQRAAPIVSGFLLGYVAMLPLIGRIADLRGRVPVLVFSLIVFAIGSLVTAASLDLTTIVLGRFLQGLGGGGLVPATLALVADIWPAERRGVPLGVVGAVQELGSVLGPLYGALVLAAWRWPAIFWINLVVGLALAAMLWGVGGRDAPARGHRVDWPGAVGVTAALLASGLLLTAPEALTSHITWGLAWLPLFGASAWWSPLGLVAIGGLALWLLRELTAAHPLVGLRHSGDLARATDLPGAALLSVALAGIVLAFATADPEVSVFSPLGPWYLALSAVAAAGFAWRQRRASHPLVPRAALTHRAAWGALAVSFFVGSALIAALVDVPIFARLTVYPDSQLGAALILVRFLAALPVGALLGGYLVRHVAAGLLTAAGMLLAAAAFVAMTQWERESLRSLAATITLVAGGLGFGIAVAPVNAALLAATEHAVHGVASAFVVVARMVGMLVGISALTTIGLTRFYAVEGGTPRPSVLCPDHPGRCPAYTSALTDAGIAQLHAVFAGAAVCALVAAALALLLLGVRKVPVLGVRKASAVPRG